MVVGWRVPERVRWLEKSGFVCESGQPLAAVGGSMHGGSDSSGELCGLADVAGRCHGQKAGFFLIRNGQ